jgi:hypothetical protein
MRSAAASLREQRRPDFGRCPVFCVDEYGLPEDDPAFQALESGLADCPARDEKDYAIGEIDLDGDVRIIPPAGPEGFAKAIEDMVYLLQAEELGFEIGFRRGRRDW